jgi:hypothetical protein
MPNASRCKGVKAKVQTISAKELHYTNNRVKARYKPTELNRSLKQ